jgi:voltage-gated sodium channel
MVGRIYQSRGWTLGVGIVIFLNSIVLGLLTEVPEHTPAAGILSGLDSAMLLVLLADCGLCVAARGRGVLQRPWDLFDIVVTVVSVVPQIDMLSALRVLRVLRVLRLLSFVPHGRATVDALFGAMRQMTAAFMVMGVVFYSMVIISTNLFRDIDPLHYGNLGRSAIHLYAIMVSFGNDPDAIVPVVSVAPWAWLVFIPFVVTASFGLLNLFIGVLAAAVRDQLDAERSGRAQAQVDRLEAKVDALSEQLRKLMT